MPYIKKEQRVLLKPFLESVSSTRIHNAGELNYLITCICQIYLIQNGESYQSHNDIVGALENIKAEWLRKKVSIYEDKKEKENGTIW